MDEDKTHHVSVKSWQLGQDTYLKVGLEATTEKPGLVIAAQESVSVQLIGPCGWQKSREVNHQ